MICFLVLSFGKILYLLVFFFFFFQAEDGIRDRNVTGVQTCALPICADVNSALAPLPSACGLPEISAHNRKVPLRCMSSVWGGRRAWLDLTANWCRKIGRASCRERV